MKDRVKPVAPSSSPYVHTHLWAGRSGSGSSKRNPGKQFRRVKRSRSEGREGAVHSGYAGPNQAKSVRAPGEEEKGTRIDLHT